LADLIAAQVRCTRFEARRRAQAVERFGAPPARLTRPTQSPLRQRPRLHLPRLHPHRRERRNPPRPRLGPRRTNRPQHPGHRLRLPQQPSTQTRLANHHAQRHPTLETTALAPSAAATTELLPSPGARQARQREAAAAGVGRPEDVDEFHRQPVEVFALAADHRTSATAGSAEAKTTLGEDPGIAPESPPSAG
jgi:hypothetical protein